MLVNRYRYLGVVSDLKCYRRELDVDTDGKTNIDSHGNHNEPIASVASSICRRSPDEFNGLFDKDRLRVSKDNQEQSRYNYSKKRPFAAF